MKGNGKSIHELTSIEAYLLSEKAGHPSHMHDYFWAQAEAIVRQRAAIVDVAIKASGKKAPKTTAKAKPAPTAKPAIAAKKAVAKKTPAQPLPAVAETVAKPTVSSAKPKAAPAAKKKSAPASKPASKPK